MNIFYTENALAYTNHTVLRHVAVTILTKRDVKITSVRQETDILITHLELHCLNDESTTVQMEVASSRQDHLPTQSITKTSKLSLLVKSLLVAERPMPALLHRLLLQCAGDIKMNPGPVLTPTPINCLRLMQWNAKISCKITQLLTFLHSNNVNIAAIQETKLTNKTKPLKTPGWAAVRLDRHKNKGGDLLMLIKDTIPFVDNTAALPQSADLLLEQQGILITMSNLQQLRIHNIYIPPRSSCSAGHNASIVHLLYNNEMSNIAGHINAHHSRWDTNANEDDRGEQLAVEIGAADYTILNENEAMRLPTIGRSTSLDISLASNDIALLSDWSVSTSLASDHLPILIIINSELSTIDGPRRTYINFKKADLARYAEACDKFLAEAGETRPIEQAEKTFRKAVNKASGLFIPARSIQHFQPTLPASAKSLADERDQKTQTKSCRRNAQRSKQTDPKTGGGRQANKMAIRSRQSNRHIASMAACKRQTTAQVAQQGCPVRRQDLPRPQNDCNKFTHQFTPPPTLRLNVDKSK